MVENHNCSLQESIIFQKQSYSQVTEDLEQLKAKYKELKDKYRALKELKERNEAKIEQLQS